jgi:predicted transposase YdaD
MKTDALYLNLFEVSPSLALHLAGYDIARASEYTCHSEELKKTFRVDAVLTPPPESDLPLVLAEVQFQKESGIYARLVASCAIMLVQSPEYREVRMVIFFANRSVDAGAGMWQPLVDAGTLQVVYLDEATELLLKEQSFSPLERASLLLARVTVSPYNRERDDAVALEFSRTLVPIEDKRSLQEFKNFFINLYLDKYNTLTYTEVHAMIASTEIFDDIGKSLAVRQYAEQYAQEVAAKTRLESALAMVSAGIPVEQVATILGLSPTAIASALASSEG